MVAWGQAKIVDKFVPGLGGKTDPVGPSPVIIHVDQLSKMVQPWFDFGLDHDRQRQPAIFSGPPYPFARGHLPQARCLTPGCSLDAALGSAKVLLEKSIYRY